MNYETLEEFWAASKQAIGGALPQGVEALSGVLGSGAGAFGLVQQLEDGTVQWRTREEEIALMFCVLPDPRDLGRVLEIFTLGPGCRALDPDRLNQSARCSRKTCSRHRQGRSTLICLPGSAFRASARAATSRADDSMKLPAIRAGYLTVKVAAETRRASRMSNGSRAKTIHLADAYSIDTGSVISDTRNDSSTVLA